MHTLIVSTIAFFVASYFIKRWAEAQDFPKGMTLNISIFVAALVVAYGVAWLVDRLAALAGA